MSHRCETSALRLPTCPARTAHLPQIARCLAQSRSAPRVSQMSLLSARRHHIISRSIGLAPAACKYRRSKVLACPIQYSHGPSFCSEGEVGYTWRDMASMPKIPGVELGSVAVGGKGRIHRAIEQRQPGALPVLRGVKGDSALLAEEHRGRQGLRGRGELIPA